MNIFRKKLPKILKEKGVITISSILSNAIKMQGFSSNGRLKIAS